jgi:uncharacterized protein (TIGR02118 family)
MIRLSVLYPAGEGHTFDMDYYLKTHIPRFQKRIGAAMKHIRVKEGVNGPIPGSPAPFVAIVHASFDSAEAFRAAFLPHAAEIQGDVPNYTNIEPLLQISEVKV